MSDDSLGGVMPKVAIRTELEPASYEDRNTRIVYDVEKAQKAVQGAEYYTREVIGYVELEPYTRFDRCEDFETFVDAVEAKSHYHTWIPERLTTPEKVAYSGEGLARRDNDA